MGELSRVEPALQGDLGVYGVGESPSSLSRGPCRRLEANSPLQWPSDRSQGPLLVRNVTELTLSPPVLRQAFKTQEVLVLKDT